MMLKSVSMGKAVVLALLTMVTIGSAVMMAENEKNTGEDTGAGAPVSRLRCRSINLMVPIPPNMRYGGNTSFKSYMDYQISSQKKIFI